MEKGDERLPISVSLRVSLVERVKNFLKLSETSFSRFVSQAINEKMEREGADVKRSRV